MIRTQRTPARTASDAIFSSTPVLAIPSLILYLVIIFLSKSSLFAAPVLTTTLANVLWLILFSLITLAIGSFILSGMIGVGSQIQQHHSYEKLVSVFFRSAKTFWLKNLIPIAIVIGIGAAVNFLAVHLAGASIPLLGERGAFVLLLILLVGGLCCVTSFFTLASTTLVIYSLGVWKSIGRSIRMVRKNYLVVASTVLGFFVASHLFEMSSALFSPFVSELAQAILIFPAFISTLIFLTLQHGSNHDLRTR